MQVIGSVFNDPKILEEQDKYVIREEDFTEEFHKIVFGAMYNIEILGGSINLETIVDYLSTRPKFYGIFQQNKGVEYLTKASEFATRDTFNYYYNRLKKFTLLRAYDYFGIDVSFLYDPTNVLDTKKKQEQEEWLDNTSIKDIIKAIDDRIDRVKAEYAEDECGEGYQAGEGALALIDQFKESPEMGIPLYGRYINTAVRGARLRKFYLRSAATGLGKALPNDTIIPTPIGDRKVGDIRPGDYLFGQDGKPTKVLAIYPQPENKQVWKMTFANGTVAKCCGEHLWKYSYESYNGKAWRVEDVQTIYNRTLKLKNGLKDSCNKGFRFHIPLAEPLQYPEKKYGVHPYIMGAAIGDGSFRYDNKQKGFQFSSENDELPNYIAELMGKGYYPKKNSEHNFTWMFKHVDNPTHNIWVEELFKDYPELWQTKSETKFIPKDYLEGSVEQRFALLQGLMDTDGHIDPVKGRTSFTTVSPQLRDDVMKLCRGLGFMVSYLVDKRKEKYTTGECYVIHIQCKKSVKPKCFHLKRKLDVAIRYSQSTKRSELKESTAIINIEKTDEYVPMTCFTVDNDDHLFLANDCIVTHNTRALLADACYFASDEIYEPQFDMWIRNGNKEPTLFIATEQDLSEIQTMAMAFLANVNEEHILTGKYEKGEEERVRYAAKKLGEISLWVECMPDFSLQDIENVMKKYIRDYNVTYIAMDYMQTSLKILEEITRRSGGVKLREDNVLYMMSTRLKDLCNQYGVFLISATQLNASYQDSETPDQNLLRGKL